MHLHEHLQYLPVQLKVHIHQTRIIVLPHSLALLNQLQKILLLLHLPLGLSLIRGGFLYAQREGLLHADRKHTHIPTFVLSAVSHSPHNWFAAAMFGNKILLVHPKSPLHLHAHQHSRIPPAALVGMYA